ncbi:MAG: hypothetical protein ABI353_15420, partial [Isosphaeraceae bacterium]
NVPTTWATAQTLAFCYDWRWRVESFFKLLKGHGHQLEQWQQETGLAITRRLLVAAMACVMTWPLQADQSPEATELKRHPDPPERSPDQAHASAHGAGPSGWTVGLALDAGVA